MTDEHATARAMYQDYLARGAVLERHRRFATDVARATSGSGQTPVEPLATMGKGGGPLLCDVCGKPMILEGGGYQGVPRRRGMASQSAAGLDVVDLGRHGRAHRDQRHAAHLSRLSRSIGLRAKADKADESNRADVPRAGRRRWTCRRSSSCCRPTSRPSCPSKNNDAVLSDIYRVLFVYDPGSASMRPRDLDAPNT